MAKYDSSSSPKKRGAKSDLGTAREDLELAEERLRKQQDLTDRTQNSLEREQQRYKDLFDLAPIGYIVTDRQGIILEANAAATHLLHASLSTVIGKALVSFIPRTGRKAFSTKLSEVSLTGEIQTWDTQLRLSKARRLEVTFQVGVIRYGSESETLSWLVQDITEARQAQAQIRALTQALLQTIEAERLNLSRELHDELGQALVSLKLMLETVPNLALTPQFEEVQAALKKLIAQVRSKALALRPILLDDAGLLAALTWHIAQYTRQTGIHVAFTHPTAMPRLQPDIEIATYRIAQQALTNIAQHANVPEAKVQLWHDDEWLYLRVADEGQGFALLHVRPNALGLLGMRERAASVGGQLDIQTAPHQGTCVTAQMPLIRHTPSLG